MSRQDRCECLGSRRSAELLAGLLLAALVLGGPAIAGAIVPATVKSRPGRHHAHPRTRHRPRRPAVKAAPVHSAPAAAPPAACPNAYLTPGVSNLPTIAGATICLVNRERAERGLPGLRENADLDRAAAGHSADMVTAGYFDHTGSQGDGPMARILASGYMTACSRCAVGENIGAGGTGSSTPAEMVAAWMGDPPHRANILDPGFRDIGVGAVAAVPVVVGGDSGATYTADFAFAGP